jgi:hypothetical protein
MTDNLTSALASVQKALPHINKGKTATVRSDKGSYSYSYADLGDIAPAIHPLLGAVGLAFVACPTTTEDGRFVLAYSLRHTCGESIDGQYPLPDPAKTTPQQIGSAITYARRYTLCSVTGVVPDEDDDGAAANNTTAKKAERIKRPAQPVVDEWTAPEGVTPPTPPSSKKTDEQWFDGWLQRVLACTSLAELKGLWSEASEQHRIGKLTNADFEQATEAKNSQKAAIERADAPAWPDVKQPPAESVA